MELNYEFITEQSKVDALLPILMEHKAWGVDTETTGKDAHKDRVTMLQIGRPDKQYIMDTRRVNPEPLRPFFESREIKKILHFAIFDYMMMKGSFQIEMEAMRCTWIAEKVMNMGRKFSGFGLDAILYDRLGISDMDKTIRQSFIDMAADAPFTPQQIEYGAKDIRYMIPLLQDQIKDLQKDGLGATFVLECDFVAPLGDMQFHGAHIDQDGWKQIEHDNMEAQAKVEESLDEISKHFFNVDLFGKPDINYGSPDQVVKLLERLGVSGVVWDREQKKEVTKRFKYFPPKERKLPENQGRFIMSSSDEALKTVKEDLPILKQLKKWRSYNVLINTFGQPYIDAIHPVTGRIQTSYNQLGTETGRLSKGSDCPVNLLNLPRDIRYRHGFTARQGYVIETDDYAGCELRILAECSDDPKFIEAFQNNEDLHCVVASELYGIEVTKTNENAKLRTPAKNLNFGIAYGMGPAKLHADLNALGFKVTRAEATQLYRDYCHKFSPAVGFLRTSGKLAAEQGYLANLNGRRRYWKLPEGDWHSNPKYKAHIAAIEREGGNFKIQSVNADLTKLSMTLIRHKKKELGYDVEFINQVYDEVVTETSEKHTKEWHPIKQKLMVEAGERWIKKVPVVVEGDVGPSWTK